MINKYFTVTLFMLIATTAMITKPSTLYPEDYEDSLGLNQVIDNDVFFPNNVINLPSEIEEQPRPDSEVFLPVSLMQALENLVVPQPSTNQITPQQIVINTDSNNGSRHSSPHTPSGTHTVTTPTSPTMPNARLTRNPRPVTRLGLARNLFNSLENTAPEDDALLPDTMPSQE